MHSAFSLPHHSWPTPPPFSPFPTCIKRLRFTAGIVIVCTTYLISSSLSLTCILRYICVSPFFYLSTSCKPLTTYFYTMNLQCLSFWIITTWLVFLQSNVFFFFTSSEFMLFFPFHVLFLEHWTSNFPLLFLVFVWLAFSLSFSLTYIVSKKTLELNLNNAIIKEPKKNIPEDKANKSDHDLAYLLIKTALLTSDIELSSFAKWFYCMIPLDTFSLIPRATTCRVHGLEDSYNTVNCFFVW